MSPSVRPWLILTWRSKTLTRESTPSSRCDSRIHQENSRLTRFELRVTRPSASRSTRWVIFWCNSFKMLLDMTVSKSVFVPLLSNRRSDWSIPPHPNTLVQEIVLAYFLDHGSDIAGSNSWMCVIPFSVRDSISEIFSIVKL